MDVLRSSASAGTADELRICVIGAGPCGLAAIKNLRAAGLRNIVCYDESEVIGGNWAFREDTGRTCVYESTHIISSKRMSAFDDFPMPDDYPDFPSHWQLLAYFDSYAAKFDLHPHIHLRTRVEEALRGADGRWRVRLSNGDHSDTQLFDHLVVCSGHHREPYVPDYPGSFAGRTLHSSAYRRADALRGQRVLVVGGGNSACDIAVDVSRVARTTCISMRQGAYIAPKLMFGHPIDQVYEFARMLIPRPVLQPVLRLALRLAIGPWEAYGLQRPSCGPLEMHPTLNASILEALRSGQVLPRVGIDRMDGEFVQFRDHRKEPFDTIIWATGFLTSFPFLPSTIVDWPKTQAPPLYLKMMHGMIPNLYFIGLFQPIGCIWQLADYQARIAAQQITGRLKRPNDIGARIEREMANPHWRFSKSPRHAIEVDVRYFRGDLLRELARA